MLKDNRKYAIAIYERIRENWSLLETCLQWPTKTNNFQSLYSTEHSFDPNPDGAMYLRENLTGMIWDSNLLLHSLQLTSSASFAPTQTNEHIRLL